jgi:hypothetical protein
MRIRLSSAWTPFYTKFFAPVWITGFGAGTLALWLGVMDDGREPDLLFKLHFLVMWVLGSTFILWFVRRLSDLWIERDELVIVRGRSEERVPLAAVVKVSETRFWNPKQIKVELQPGAGTRSQVIFVAPQVIQLPFTDHPSVRQLRELAQLARSRDSSHAVRPR